jgi:lipid A 4'-phosphatase
MAPLNPILAALYSSDRPRRPRGIPDAQGLTSILLASILASFAIFALWPGIDLGVSRAFHDPSSGFRVDGLPLVEALRQAIWKLSILLCLAAACGVVLGWAGREVLLPARAWGFILMLYILGPGVMVDQLTKPLWGRARPAQVAEFGGPLQFSPPNELVDFCTRNCSFVSGEVSGATVTALALLLIRLRLRRRLHKTVSIILLTAAVCIPVVVATQRIASGRHFLSDTIFSVLFTLGLALALAAMFRPILRNLRSTQFKWRGALRTDP